LENIESGTGKHIETESTSDGEKLAFHPGDVLFGKLRPYLAKVFLPDFSGACTTEFLVLRPSFEVSARFLFYHLLSPKFIDLVTSFSSGAKMPRAEWDVIGNLEFDAPKISQQRAIADFLDRETAKIDDLIAKNQSILNLLGQARCLAMERAVLSGLRPAEAQRPTPVPSLPAVPCRWSLTRVAYLFHERDERGKPDLPLLNVSLNTGVTVRSFSDEKIERVAEDFGTYKVARNGDMAFNKMRMWQGAVGVAPTDGLVSPDYTVAKPNTGVSAHYYAMVFRTSAYKCEVNRYSHGIAPDRNRIYWDDFKQIVCPHPPYEEQLAIVHSVELEYRHIDSNVSLVTSAIALLREYRSALISTAVTGQLDLRQHEAQLEAIA
jgi:type I restriction enzyme S subunit